MINGAGRIGLMGASADACLAHGGKVVGIIPQHLVEWEVAHDGLTELIVVNTMHERKSLMVARSNAFIALPGGFGTYDELCEVLTWAQLNLHDKPIGILNILGFFDGLIMQFQRAVQDGLLEQRHLDKLIIRTEVDELLQAVLDFAPVITTG